MAKVSLIVAVYYSFHRLDSIYEGISSSLRGAGLCAQGYVRGGWRVFLRDASRLSGWLGSIMAERMR